MSLTKLDSSLVTEKKGKAERREDGCSHFIVTVMALVHILIASGYLSISVSHFSRQSKGFLTSYNLDQTPDTFSRNLLCVILVPKEKPVSFQE